MSSNSLVGPLLLQLVLIFVNAFFAMAEIACIGVNDNKLNKIATEGNKKAIRLQKLLKDPSRFFSTIQVGVTLAGFLASAFAAENFAARLVGVFQSWGVSLPAETLHTICVVIITLILSYFTLVLGELVPKRIAQKYSEAIALNVAVIIRGIAVVTKPVVWLLTVSTNGVLRLLRMNPEDEAEDVTEEEIRMLLDIGQEKGTIDQRDGEMIDNIFELDDCTVEDLMTHRTDMVALRVDSDHEAVRRVIGESGHTRFPVYDENIDDIIGMLHVRDYMLNSWQESPLPMREILRSAYFVPSTLHANVLFRDMQQKNIHMAILIDEYGGTQGLVTMEDLLEQIVGNIYDEYDPEDRDIEQLDDNSYRINGSVYLEDIEKLFDITLPVDEFDTLSGLIFSQLSVIPEDSQHPIDVEVGGLQVHVEKIEDRRVSSAVVRLCKSDHPKDDD